MFKVLAVLSMDEEASFAGCETDFKIPFRLCLFPFHSVCPFEPRNKSRFFL
jgi:hypothetical protein